MQILSKFTRMWDYTIIFGVICLFIPLLWSWRASILQSCERSDWDNQMTQSVDYDSIKTRMTIPAIGVDAVVVDEVTEADLDRGPMRLAGTVSPGRPGNCCIAAHKEKWFRRLPELKAGDKVLFQTQKTQYTYAVTGQKVVPPTDVSVLDDKQGCWITLITCTGRPYFQSRGKRLVITAMLTKTTKLR